MNVGESEQKERGKWVLSEYVILPSDFYWGLGFISKYQKIHHFAYVLGIIINPMNSMKN